MCFEVARVIPVELFRSPTSNMCQAVIWLSTLIIVFSTYCDGARILGIIATPSYSHQVVFRPIWRELSLRGHQLTVLTTDPMNDPSLTNLTEIDLHFTYKPWNQVMDPLIQSGLINPITFIQTFFGTMNQIIDQELQHVEVQQLINNQSEHFDLLMAEFLFPTMFAFSHRFKCPFIGMTSLDAPSGVYMTVGNPTHPVVNPDLTLPFTAGELSFFERVISVLVDLVTKHVIYESVLTKEELTVEKHFGKDYPSLRPISSEMSMLFVNADPIFHQIRATVPAVVQIGGGTHMHTTKPLPEELQRILDAASQGFIYFSLGSNVKSQFLPERTRSILLQAFAELPYQVLWKFELDDLPGKPENVLISKWFPQQDIFKHPNIKLFITQGGLQSMEEAIYNHIPMVGMPYFADQPINVKRMVSKGLALSVDHEKINKEDFKSTILEVIENPKYRNKVKEAAQLVQDQPTTGLERAVWWTEYVLRHKGARHLRSPLLDLPWYQYFLLDVIGFCLLVAAIVIYVLVKLVRAILKLIKYFITKPKLKVQ